jgi:hypothetical protein
MWCGIVVAGGWNGVFVDTGMSILKFGYRIVGGEGRKREGK